jgi:hypothetical protein
MVSLEAVRNIINISKEKAEPFNFDSDFLQTFSIPKNKMVETIEPLPQKTSIFSVNDIIELPANLKEILADSDDYYMYGCRNLFDSLLFGNMLDYKLFSDDKKKKLQHDFKMSLISKVKEIVMIHDLKVKSVEMTEKINKYDCDNHLMMYLSHFLKRTIVVLSLSSKLYSIYGVDYSNPITIIKENQHFMILIHTLSKPFSTEKMEQLWNEKLELLKITKYKLTDLVEIANKLNISVLNEHGKKKIKSLLYQEIFNKLN